MKRRYLVLCVLVPLLAPLAIVAACTSSPAASPTSPAPNELPVSFDARLDTSRPPAQPDAAPPPTCNAIDLPAGTGTRFCDLPVPPATGLSVPDDFCIHEFTMTPIIEARVMRFAPNGDLFLAALSMSTPGGATNGPGSILVLPDDNGDGCADSVLTFAGGSVRPKVREDCAQSERPCSFVSCAHHPYLDVSARTGAIKVNFPDLEIWEMTESCALDIADRGGTTLEEIGAIMNLTRERIRQVEVTAFAKLEALGDMSALRDFVVEGPVGKRRLPILAKTFDADELASSALDAP